MRRVVVTGLGTVNPLGPDVPGTWRALNSGRSGIVAVPDLDGLPVRIAGVVDGFDPEDFFDVQTARQYDRFAQFALVAARQARQQAGLLDVPGDERWATVVGTGLGGVGTYGRAVRALADGRRSVSAYTAAAMVPSAAAAAVSREAAALGPALTPVTACASGTDAVGIGVDLIRLGRADVVLAGGADAPVTRAMASAFAAMGAASRRNDEPAAACRPFAADRTGLVMGEGAAVLVLESAEHADRRGATPLAEVAGHAATNDAHHLTAPRPDGRSAAAAVRAALVDAATDPRDVDYVNAHGTGTPLNDRVEAQVLAAVLGGEVPVSSTKAQTGHLMGAAGALEALLCVRALGDGVVPATRNCDELDPDCAGIDVVRGEPRTALLRVAVSTSFGFGGHNAALVLRRG